MAPPQTPVTSALARPSITASPLNVTLTITAVLMTGAENAFAFAVCQSLSLSPGAFWQLPGGHLPRLCLDCKAKEPHGLLHGSHAKHSFCLWYEEACPVLLAQSSPIPRQCRLSVPHLHSPCSSHAVVYPVAACSPSLLERGITSPFTSI